MRVDEEEEEEKDKKSRRSSSLTTIETDHDDGDYRVDPSEEQRNECARVLVFYDLGRCVGRGATSQVQ
jgi:hypothetical protein